MRRIFVAVLVGACSREPARSVDSAGGSDLVVSSSPVIRAGGVLYVAPVEPNGADLVVELASREISVAPRYLSWDGSLSLYDVPDDLPLGPVDVRVWTRTAPEAVEVRHAKVVDPVFVDVADATGLVFTHQVSGWDVACAESLTGIGTADYDRDGDRDVFVGNLTADSVFYRNDGDLDRDGLPDFTPATAEAGLTGHDLVSNVSFADYDNDGDPDLYLGRRGHDRLLENRVVPDGVATFVDVSREALPAPTEQRTMGSAWGDFDGDGDLDLYVLHHTWCYPGADGDDPRNADALYRNDAGVFVEVTDLMSDRNGEISGRYGFTALWLDFDRDADQDLFVFNDHIANGGRGVAWRNDGESAKAWGFENVTKETGFFPLKDTLGKTVNAMGAAVGDLNHDGRPDFAYTNIGPNFLLLSRVEADGGVVYDDVSLDAGITRTLLPWEDVSTTWAAHLFDHDNDGDLDLFFAGGALKGTEPHPHAFFENLGDATFVDRTWEVGLESPRHGKSSALVDLDDDGFLELLVANWSDRLEVYRNVQRERGNANHWLRIDPLGDGARVNRDGFGAIVALTTPDGITQTCFRTPMPSLSATGDPTCHFGLGAQTSVVDVTVTWPDGTVQQVPIDGVDRRIEVVRAP